MILERIELRNFRNYESLKLDFSKGFNPIIGENGSGKTNLAEAIYYISLARSWRRCEDKILIKEGCESAYIKADVREGELVRRIEIEIFKNKKKISINGKPIRRISDLSKLTNAIIFSPTDVRLYKERPSDRRTFLDIAISKHFPDYLSLAMRYEKLLKERNALLKEQNPDLRLLKVLDEQIVEVSEPLLKYRHIYVELLNKILPTLVSKLKGEPSEARIEYRSYLELTPDFKQKALEAYERNLEADIRSQSTGIGPHREDIRFILNGKDIADYGSQGENRICSLASKLAPYFLIEEEGRKPICVLDDVASELDDLRLKNLMNLTKELSQVFITATKIEKTDIPYIEVVKGIATRRNQ